MLLFWTFYSSKNPVFFPQNFHNFAITIINYILIYHFFYIVIIFICYNISQYNSFYDILNK